MNVKPGDRVILVSMNDPYSRIPSGTEGTVQCVDSLGTVHVRWDNGSGLGLIPGEDRFVVIGKKPEA